MGIQKMLRRAGVRAADTIAKLSVLSPEQLNELEKKRNQYLMEMPSMDDYEATEITERLLAAAGIEIYNEYLENIEELYLPLQEDTEYGRKFRTGNNIRWFQVNGWVKDKKENTLEKLVNVYEVLSREDCNIALVFHRTVKGTEVYLGVSNMANDTDNIEADIFSRRLMEAVRGNFPGAELEKEVHKGPISFMEEDPGYSIAMISNVPGEKSEKFISQTIEKLLDGIIPADKEQEYTLVLLATPVRDAASRKLHLGGLYSGLAPYAGWQTSFTYTESDSANSSAVFGLNAGINAGLQRGNNTSQSTAHGITDNTGRTVSDSTSSSTTDSSSTSQGKSFTSTENEGTTRTAGTNFGLNESRASGVSGGFSIGIEDVASVGANTSLTHTAGKSAGSSISKALSKSTGTSLGESLTQTAGQSLSQSIGQSVANTLGKAISNTASVASGIYKGVNAGGSFGANFARSSNVSATVGKNEGITQSFTNYTIRHTLEILEEQMKRLEQSTALGLWDFAAYVFGEDLNVVNNAAHTYLALTQGENSYLSQTAVNFWRGDMGEESRSAQEVYAYLRQMRHPLFALNPEKTDQMPELNAYPAIINGTAALSGKELAYSLNFPARSISGFPVLECTEFGRNIVRHHPQEQGRTLHLGQIFHMNRPENTPVQLSLDSLSSHTFIAGGTGTGKSNTICHILQEAGKQEVPFLVIEPAKGEYGQVFGSREDVQVYGTNPLLSELLKLDPFSFPEEIHVYEHIDRLIEIFNVCWPMYAAMPAVLKQAVEKAYEDCGWNLQDSQNRYEERIYPVFEDVIRNIKQIMESSEYDTENKGAYKGALITRLQSLTNGIWGLIFTADEIPASTLFETNVIADLSRVGSTETKALIMGILLLKLQEYHMAHAREFNVPLKHLTVLEEAHILLKKSHPTAGSESEGIAGKSVEMIANAIAEMRAYGEGFIIADQAPGLLDTAVIRNTGTKILLRMPELSDRQLSGSAANLNEEQIAELAKLPRGTAAVYQNEWLQPILCQVEKFQPEFQPEAQTPEENTVNEPDPTHSSRVLYRRLIDQIATRSLYLCDQPEHLQSLKEEMLRSPWNGPIKTAFLEYLDASGTEREDAYRRFVYQFLKAEDILSLPEAGESVSRWKNRIRRKLPAALQGYGEPEINSLIFLLLNEHRLRQQEFETLFYEFSEAKRNGILR